MMPAPFKQGIGKVDYTHSLVKELIAQTLWTPFLLDQYPLQQCGY